MAIDRFCLSKEEMMLFLRKELIPGKAAAADEHIAGCEFCHEALEGIKDFLEHNSPEVLETTLTGVDQELKRRVEKKNINPLNRSISSWKRMLYWILPFLSVIIILVLYFLLSKKDDKKYKAENFPPPKALVLPVRDSNENQVHVNGEKKAVEVPLKKSSIAMNKTEKRAGEKSEEKISTTQITNKESEIPDQPLPGKGVMETQYKSEIFTVVEMSPEYPDGDEARIKFLRENINYPKAAIELGIQGKVFVTFVVETDGTISDVRVLRGIGGGCDEEAIRVVKMMPKWIPGKQRGTPVRVQYNLPVKFSLQ